MFDRALTGLLLAFAFLILMLTACGSSPAIPQEAVVQPQQPATSLPPSPLVEARPTRTSHPTATTAATASATAGPLPPPPTATIQPSITPSPTPAYPQYDGLPLRRDEIGVQIHIHREDLRPLLRHLRALNAGWVKVQVSWKLYQPHPDSYAEDRLAELDDLVEAANNNDIQVLLSVSKAPEWSRPTTELDGPPAD